MDALKFLNEKDRICRSYAFCNSCPFFTPGRCEIGKANNIDKVLLVEKWSEEHPAKTRLSEF